MAAGNCKRERERDKIKLVKTHAMKITRDCNTKTNSSDFALTSHAPPMNIASKRCTIDIRLDGSSCQYQRYAKPLEHRYPFLLVPD